MTWQSEMDELRRREAMAEELGGPERVKRQHAGGRMRALDATQKRVCHLALEIQDHDVGLLRAHGLEGGVGIWHADLEHLLETRTLRELKGIFDDNGLRHLELEFLMDWFLDPDDERRREADRIRTLLWAAAA